MQDNVEEIAQLEHDAREARTAGERVAEAVTGFSGSVAFVWLQAGWFALWIVLSTLGLPPRDAYPFGLLTMIVSLEAIFLTTLILITQNRQAQIAERREKVHVQVNVRAEQEITKLVEMLTTVQTALGIAAADDHEAHDMAQPTDIRAVASAVDAAERGG